MRKAKRNRRYRDSYRGYLVDHHSPDPPVQPLDKLDVSEWEEALKRARVNCMLTYCKDHYGVTYYDTKVGRKHPGLKTDWIGEVAEMMRRNDIEFWAYYSVGFDLWAAKTHPEWAARDENDNVVRVGTKWPWCCGNTGYREYIMAQLEEILAYEPDSMFLDIVHTPLCWCKSCRKLFRERYGFPLPKGHAKLKHWRTLLGWHTDVMQYDLFKTIVDRVHEIDPTVPISMNGSHLRHAKKVQDLMDWTYAEPWAGNSVSAGFARGTGVDSQIGPGGVSQVYNPYPASVFVTEIAAIAAQGVRPFLFSGTLKPDGSLDRLEFDEIGAAYREVEKFQPLLRNRDAVREVAVLFSEQTRLYGLDKIKFREDRHGCLDDTPYTDVIAGAINAAAVTKYPWEVVPEWSLTQKELVRHRVLVLPNANAISDRHARLIAAWVKAGGRLLATFRTGMKDETGEPRDDFALAKVLGVQYVGMDETYVGSQQYGSYLDDRTGPLWDSLPDTCLAVAPPMVQVNTTTADELATHTMPACKETPEQWVNWWPAPPAARTDWPAVTLNRYGKGLAMYVGFDVFNMMRRTGGRPFVWSWRFLTAALENVLLPEPCMRVHTAQPRSLDVTYAKVRRRKQILVHLLNNTAKSLHGDVVSIPGGELVVRRAPFRVRSARVVYPRERDLVVRKEARTTVVRLPSVRTHTVVSLE